MALSSQDLGLPQGGSSFFSRDISDDIFEETLLSSQRGRTLQEAEEECVFFFTFAGRNKTSHQEIDGLEKLVFNLKLRIYFLEERLGNQPGGLSDNAKQAL